MVSLSRRLFAEFLGTALLVAVVIGSGIAAQRLSPDDTGLQLLQNSLTTVFELAVLILVFGPVSGAHFNPVVSAVDRLLGRRTGGGLSGRDVAGYTLAQTVGAVGGAVLAAAADLRGDLLGAALGTAAVMVLYPDAARTADQRVVPHDPTSVDARTAAAGG